MVNLIGDIYDEIKLMVDTHIEGYLQLIREEYDFRIPSINNVYREWVDIYELPTYPSVVFGYGQVTFQEDERTTAHEILNFPVSLYAVVAGADSLTTQKLCEIYTFALLSVMTGEDTDKGVIDILGMGTSPVEKRTNQLVQVGYIDIALSATVARKQN